MSKYILVEFMVIDQRRRSANQPGLSADIQFSYVPEKGISLYPCECECVWVIFVVSLLILGIYTTLIKHTHMHCKASREFWPTSKLKILCYISLGHTHRNSRTDDARLPWMFYSHLK